MVRWPGEWEPVFLPSPQRVEGCWRTGCRMNCCTTEQLTQAVRPGAPAGPEARKASESSLSAPGLRDQIGSRQCNINVKDGAGKNVLMLEGRTNSRVEVLASALAISANIADVEIVRLAGLDPVPLVEQAGELTDAQRDLLCGGARTRI